VVTKIRLGQQRQARKPIYLLPTGVVECGRFRYEGRYKKKFKSVFGRICSLAPTKPKDGVLDVSDYKYWDAPRIYDDYVVPRWCKFLSAVRLSKLASETQIVLMLAEIQREFREQWHCGGRKNSRNLIRMMKELADKPGRSYDVL
jgi:hypothetical protein